MSVTVHIPAGTPGKKFFLGEDKQFVITLLGVGTIAGQDFAFVMKERIGDQYVEVLRKDTTIGGLVITDAANRVLTVTFVQADTNGTGPWRPIAGRPYPFSLKRLGVGADHIATDGTLTFDEATQKEP